MTTNPNPLASLSSAEAHLVKAVAAAADALDQVAAGDVNAALGRLQASADAARARIASAFCRVQDTLADVTWLLEHAAGEVLSGQDGGDRRQLELPAGHAAIAEAPAAELPAADVPVAGHGAGEVDSALTEHLGTDVCTGLGAPEVRRDAETSSTSPATSSAASAPRQGPGDADSVRAVAACRPVAEPGRNLAMPEPATDTPSASPPARPRRRPRRSA